MSIRGLGFFTFHLMNIRRRESNHGTMVVDRGMEAWIVGNEEQQAGATG